MQLFGTEGAELALLIIPADTEPLIAAQRMRHASGQSSNRGWGTIPDQYGRRWDGDDGGSPIPPDPGLADLPALQPLWGGAPRRDRH